MALRQMQLADREYFEVKAHEVFVMYKRHKDKGNRSAALHYLRELRRFNRIVCAINKAYDHGL